MARTFRFTKAEPLLDIASYARGGLRSGGQLTSAQFEQVRRTIGRVPEAVVKVLPRGSNDLKAAGKHLDYIGRHGDLDLESDDGERLRGRIGPALLEDWDLDIDDMRRKSDLVAASSRKPPKLIHKLMFSMPPGTPPDKVLGAVRNFAREQFALQHRYALVLHTDEPHPHVHLMLKAVNEQGVRLNIRKATLRVWRSEFARHLRLLGVAANATERAVRGESRSSKKDGIYRATKRGESTFLRAQAQSVARQLSASERSTDSGRRQLTETRNQVVNGWSQMAMALEQGGQRPLADKVRRFLTEMQPARTDCELIAAEMTRTIRAWREPQAPSR